MWGKRETITDQMQAVNKATQGCRCGSTKRGLLGWCADVSEAVVFTLVFQYLCTKLVATHLHICLRNRMQMTKQASCCELLFIAHLETQASVAMLLFRGIWNYYHIEGNQSLVAAVLWAALCSIALETGLIGMCGPNSPHCLKLAGFMFTTIGFGIAALDCLCFAVRVRVCVTSRVQS